MYIILIENNFRGYEGQNKIYWRNDFAFVLDNNSSLSLINIEIIIDRISTMVSSIFGKNLEIRVKIP